MPMPQQLARLLEIKCSYSDTEDGYGSGFLLGNGLALTARHVFASDDMPIPDKPDIRVRTVSMLKADQPWLDAELVWPTWKNMRENDPDIALIRVTQGELANSDPPNIHLFDALHDETRGRSAVERVHAVGFPNFAKRLGSRRETSQINGRVKLADGIVSETLEFNNIDFDVKAGKKIDEYADWHGFSGAALFLSDGDGEDSLDALAGVVITYEDDKLYEFGAVRISALKQDQVAMTLLRDALPRAGQVADSPTIHKLVCLLDRRDQEQEFLAAYEREEPPATDAAAGQVRCAPGARPTILILPGAGVDRHAPNELAVRLHDHTLTERLHWPLVPAGARMIPWPSKKTGVDPLDAVTRMRRDLWNTLGGTGATPGDPLEYAKRMSIGTAPRFFVSDDLSGGEHLLDEVSASVLREWSRFWSGILPQDGRAPIHLVFVHADLDQAVRWRTLAACSRGICVEVLPELDMCRTRDITNWITFELKRRLPSEFDDFLITLESELNETYQGAFYLHDLKMSVLDLVKRNFHG